MSDESYESSFTHGTTVNRIADPDGYVCAQCRSALHIPPDAEPDRDDVRVCDECFEPAETPFLEAHHADAVAIGVYPIAGGGPQR